MSTRAVISTREAVRCEPGTSTRIPDYNLSHDHWIEEGTIRALSLVWLVALGGFPTPARAQFADSITTVHMGGSVYMLMGAGDVITASVGPDGVLLVDDGFMQTEPAVRAALERLGGGAPRYVINTHWHHAGANAAFAAEATIIAHRKARNRLRDGAVMYVQEMPPAPDSAWPDVVFDDSLSLFFNGEEIQLVHLPAAHTDGDIAVIFPESRVAALGDLYVTFIPITDYASGGDLYKSKDAIASLVQRLEPGMRIVPGHGRPSSYEEMVAFNEMLEGMIAHVERQVELGRSAEEVIALGIPAAHQSWMGDLLTPEFVLQNLYEGVTRRR